MSNRQDNALVTASVEWGPAGARQVLALGVYEDRTGGDSDSTTTRYPRGGLGPNEALGGRQEVSTITISRLFDETARGYRKKLRGLTGKATIIINEQPIDDEQVPVGEPETWTGVLKAVKVSDRKADSAAAALLELEVTPTGQVA
jgi:hypothetical protein